MRGLLDDARPRRIVFARVEFARAAFQRVARRFQLRRVRRKLALAGLVGRRQRREGRLDTRPRRRSEGSREEDGVLEIRAMEARNNTSARQQFRLVRREHAPGSRQGLLAAVEGAAGAALDLGPRDLSVAVLIQQGHEALPGARSHLGRDRFRVLEAQLAVGVGV